MKASAVRTALLAQHRELRALLSRAEDLAGRALSEPAYREDFRAAAGRLRAALAGHNASEEAILEPVLRAGDKYSPMRVARMIEEHAAEHAAMQAALDEGDDLALARALPELAEELRAHMDAEERTFLHPKVLAD